MCLLLHDVNFFVRTYSDGGLGFPRRPICRRPFPWTREMDNFMLDTMLDYACDEPDTRTHFNLIMNVVCSGLAQACNVVVTLHQAKHRLRVLRNWVKIATKLIVDHGFEMDINTQKFDEPLLKWERL
ncbi:hypothetical protein FRX31_031233 [Thalictrum thalictroides]|uniref:Uncharacterized protein n=1 Tax=Thalictrum thalictroides TaxID=46969 RepID=A0A7J6V4K0_THATH|nr:hypothetical protein FRX31_031233 [Thalictrum thalictroides]